MDPVSALGILGVIFNFFELSGKLLFHAREIHKSPKGLTAAIQDADAISTDLLNSFKLLKALGSSAASRDVDQNLLGLVTPCTEIAEELLKISQRLANRDKKQKAWSTAVQAFLSVATQRKVDDLICRLERLKGQVHMNVAVMGLLKWENTKLQLQEHERLLHAVRSDIQSVQNVVNQRPRDAGYPWETAPFVLIDDGLDLDPFPLPKDLCASPSDLRQVLEIKYRSRDLPGLRQIQHNHLQLWHWDESRPVGREDWLNLHLFKGVKLAFVMGQMWGFKHHKKCLRCRKPRPESSQSNIGQVSRFRTCTSCKLSLLEVEPDYFDYEPFDTSIQFGGERYRNFRTGRKPCKKSNLGPCLSSAAVPQSTPGEVPADEGGADTGGENKAGSPLIDFVCRRMILKWEPILNIVHRYLLCRCVIRLSTPSKWFATDEQTLLELAPCPRHNDMGVSYWDYGSLVNYHEDPYFAKYGGYDMFRMQVVVRSQTIEAWLGHEKFLSDEELNAAIEIWRSLSDERQNEITVAMSQYRAEYLDCLDRNGVKIPADQWDILTKHREENTAMCEHMGLDGFELSESQREDIRNSAMVRELQDILSGKASGKPHWRVEL